MKITEGQSRRFSPWFLLCKDNQDRKKAEHITKTAIRVSQNKKRQEGAEQAVSTKRRHRGGDETI